MSYLQEIRVAATHGEMAVRTSAIFSARRPLALLLFLAFLHGALYAFFLPPWGLIDEAQHLHYIQYLAEEQALPVTGDLYLSDEIIASLFATRHWETFHWTPPSPSDPKTMGSEGHSYEAYQPPLFYLLMTPLYLAFPQDMVVKVYGLRAAMVLLSLLTVWALYRTAELLLPHFPGLPFAAGLLLVAIPERAIATSRINNDVLLEVVAALFFFVLTQATFAGLSRRRSLLLGLFVGLGVWVKISAALLVLPLLLLLWRRRRDPAWWREVGWVIATAAPLALVLLLRNIWLYGDLTGFSAFNQIHRLSPVDTSLTGFVTALASLANHFWLVWWKGSTVGGNWLLTAFYWAMAAVVALAWVRLFVELRRWAAFSPNHVLIVLIYALTVLLYAIAVINSYYQGMVPVIQGRFMLPALLPFVLLLVWGLWLYACGEQMLLVVVVLLWGMGILSLFGNLIPYFYYWSEVLLGTMPPLADLRGEQWVALVYQRLLLDKPPFLTPLLWLLPIVYGLTLLYILFVTLRSLIRSQLWFAGHNHTPVHSQL